jgi:hypothetical protein
MKKYVIAALLAGSLSVPAFAQSAPSINETVNFNGQRPVECNIDGLERAVNFLTLDRFGNAAGVTNSSIEVFCNQPSTVSVQSLNGYLKLVSSNANAAAPGNQSNLTSQANPGFSAGLNYSATISGIPGGSLVANTTQIGAGSANAVIFSPVPALNVPAAQIFYDTIPEAQPLLGGVYQDILTISITPNGV